MLILLGAPTAILGSVLLAVVRLVPPSTESAVGLLLLRRLLASRLGTCFRKRLGRSGVQSDLTATWSLEGAVDESKFDTIRRGGYGLWHTILTSHNELRHVPKYFSACDNPL